jgi:Tol biopolymer transport system component
MHRDASGLERLTENPAFDDQGVLSPDGKTLAFVSTRNGGTTSIWLMDLKTRRARELTRGTRAAFRPAWSPDGAWIAFSSDRDSPHQRLVLPGWCGWELMQFTAIYMIHPDGTDLRRLTPAGPSSGSPTWSRDGKRIAYYESRDGQAPAQIVSLDVTTGATTTRTSVVGGALSPHYLVDDDIGYALVAGYQKRLAATSGLVGPVAPLSNPSWSPDGNLVVYSKPVTPTSREPLPLVPTFSRDSRFELYLSGTDPFSVRYSADGRRLVVARNDGDYHWIELMNADGSDRREIFRAPNPEMLLGAIAWSRDETLIAFTVGRLASRNPVTPTQIGLVRSDGSGFRMLTTGDNSSAYPSFSPDSTRIVYRVLGRERGLRLMSLRGACHSTHGRMG